jgi:transcriptional regulator with XRE-family HTH domain
MKKRHTCILLSKKNSNALDNISKRIRYLRELTGLERQEVEARHQIKVVSLDKWENGRANISTKNIARLINMALDHSIECTTEWLISGEGPPQKQSHLHLSPSSKLTPATQQKIF